MSHGISGIEFARSAQLEHALGSLTRHPDNQTRLIFTPYLMGYGFLQRNRIDVEAEQIQLIVQRGTIYLSAREHPILIYFVTFSSDLDAAARTKIGSLPQYYEYLEQPALKILDRESRGGWFCECSRGNRAPQQRPLDDDHPDCYCNCGSGDCAYDCGGSDCACSDCDCGDCIGFVPQRSRRNRPPQRRRYAHLDDHPDCYCNCGNGDCAYDCGGSDCACSDCDCGDCIGYVSARASTLRRGGALRRR